LQEGFFHLRALFPDVLTKRREVVGWIPVFHVLWDRRAGEEVFEDSDRMQLYPPASVVDAREKLVGIFEGASGESGGYTPPGDTASGKFSGTDFVNKSWVRSRCALVVEVVVSVAAGGADFLGATEDQHQMSVSSPDENVVTASAWEKQSVEAGK
jgi:hypothetical protein